MSSLPPLTLYIHYPWCIKKCPYCDFNSHEIKQSRINYIPTLLKDLDNELAFVQGRSLDAIFIGGGTPSLMSGLELKQLLQGIEAKIPFLADIEITLEANPATAEAQKFADFRENGVNRLSIGVQSFDNAHLKTLGRAHNAIEAKQVILVVKQAGFTNFNIDLMYGLPLQTPVQALDDLQTAIDFSPSHLSCYQLTIEPNTYFAKFPPSLPDAEQLHKIEQSTKALLAQHNYAQYEVSAYSNTPSKHNLNYWQFGDYLGIGAGAHSKLTQENKIIRRTKPKSPNDYLKNPMGKSVVIQAKDLPFEFMLNALRLKQGFSPDLFCQTTKLPLSSIQEKLDSASKLGLLTQKPDLIKPTTKGFDFLNDLQEHFL